MIRLLRPLHIQPEILKSRLDSGAKVGVIDLLRFEEDPEGVLAIPGALRLDPLELRRKKRITMPPDLDLVLYCRSRNSFVSARVAAVMRKHGIQNVLILTGGLEAWKARGLPLSDTFATTEVELVRLGIEMSPPWQPLPPQKR